MTSSDDLVREARSGAVSGISKVPQRAVAVVTCMDARVDPLPALGLRPGDAHVIRNAGAIVTEDVLRSLVISQRVLGTNAIDLMMHTDCGMLGLDGEGMVSAIAAEIGEPFEMRFLGFANLRAELQRGVEVLRTSKALPNRGQIRGLLFDVAAQRPDVVIS